MCPEELLHVLREPVLFEINLYIVCLSLRKFFNMISIAFIFLSVREFLM